MPIKSFSLLILVTVLMSDAKNDLRLNCSENLDTSGFVNELLYADDTLLIDTHGGVVQQYMDSVVKRGGEYGLQIHWKKVEILPIKCTPRISTTSGEYIECKSSISYLGALLDTSGSIQSELARRIGMATADFKALSRIWNHTSVTKELKYRIYQACIVSKLLYGLQVAWLTKTQRVRLDGFHARCVRKIVGVPHSFWSRISNADVLEKIHARPLSLQLLEQQLLLFGKIFRRPDEDIMRQMVFNPGCETLRTSRIGRARGRPRLSWSTEVYKQATLLNHGSDSFGMLMADAGEWGARVRAFCSN